MSPPLATNPWPVLGCLLAALLASAGDAQAQRRPRTPTARLQVLSGVGLVRPSEPDPAAAQEVSAYVPLDVELDVRVSGPLSLTLGGVGYLAPFVAAGCLGSAGRRPNALAAFGGVRLDPWQAGRSVVSPWLALRAGVVGQAGVGTGDRCQEGVAIAPWFGPRLGLDFNLGQTALTTALGYDYLPRAGAISLQVGLALRIF